MPTSMPASRSGASTLSTVPQQATPGPVMSVLGALWTRILVSMASLSSVGLLTREAAGAVNGGRLLADLVSECRVGDLDAVSYTHLRAHETRHDFVCRLLLAKKKRQSLLYTSPS